MPSAKKSEIESLVQQLESLNPTPYPTQELETVTSILSHWHLEAKIVCFQISIFRRTNTPFDATNFSSYLIISRTLLFNLSLSPGIYQYECHETFVMFSLWAGSWVLEACLQYNINFGIKEDKVRPQRLYLAGWIFSDNWYIQGKKTMKFSINVLCCSLFS